jgi:hypothetical protein
VNKKNNKVKNRNRYTHIKTLLVKCKMRSLEQNAVELLAVGLEDAPPVLRTCVHLRLLLALSLLFRIEVRLAQNFPEIEQSILHTHMQLALLADQLALPAQLIHASMIDCRLVSY